MDTGHGDIRATPAAPAPTPAAPAAAGISGLAGEVAEKAVALEEETVKLIITEQERTEDRTSTGGRRQTARPPTTEPTTARKAAARRLAQRALALLPGAAQHVRQCGRKPRSDDVNLDERSAWQKYERLAA